MQRRGFRFLLQVFFEAPRCMMIVSCAPVMEEIRVHQRKKLIRSTHLHEFLNLFYVQNIIASAVHHRLG